MLQKFLTLYYMITTFQIKKIKMKNKNLQSPWLTSGIKKSSKRNNVYMENSPKNLNKQNQLEYKS